MKRRRRSSLASRSPKARSRRSSIALSEIPRRPTSVRGSVDSTRWERSPPAIAPAVCPMRSSGSRPTRTTAHETSAEDDQDAGDDEGLDHEQLLQRVVGGAQGDGDHGGRPVPGIGRGEHAIARVHALATVDVDDLPGRELGRERRLGRHGLVEAEDLVGDHPPARVALLAVGPSGHAEVGTAARAAAGLGAAVAVGLVAHHLLERAADRHDRGPELLVDAGVLERALLDVGDPAREQEAARREGQDGREQPRPQ